MEGDNSVVKFTNQPVIIKKKEVTKKKQSGKAVASNGKEAKKTKQKLRDVVLGKSVAESASVGCALMEEFDQFVEHQSLSKRTEELTESQEAEMGFSLFGAIEKEVEEGARNIMSQDFEISNNDEQ
ncbi:uncharacterized protein LOC125551429 [Triticum urartu]|uniref:uncharacterized protein LOC125551429 n=1 Tax=Triticum urartu TaxID=4572 RepID=UPI00204472B0|nr:uncharacterized protein LOC125551429 [Triticum urartu]